MMTPNMLIKYCSQRCRLRTYSLIDRGSEDDQARDLHLNPTIVTDGAASSVADVSKYHDCLSRNMLYLEQLADLTHRGPIAC